MQYQVHCECKRSITVSGADAGASVRCPCGKTVEVPPLHKLRASAGQITTSPELTLEAMLARGELPDTPNCESCSQFTPGIVWIELMSESSEAAKMPEEAALGCLVGIVSGITDLILKPEPKRPAGYNVWFRIPIRCCPSCEQKLKNTKCREILRRHQLSAALLDKWPHLIVRRVKK
ncbi:unnamed protein product [Gemmataceae bacterium]|nr:unnamed protein product [Gemmataceae bacterium]VTU00795.1 unnamed protein product [Gemmataceae bacterium]